ncbi:MAG TPA: hypothetical protein VKV02_12090 [Acidobacteriaceae bacterium]|nr:hypothetical protein [Acidobacteriaceae bacterium]
MSDPLPLAAAWFLSLPLSTRLESLSPDAAVCLATAGLCLIALELNRPGLILPGSIGLLLVLFGMDALRHHPCRPWAACLVSISALLLALNWWKRLPLAVLIASPVAAILGVRFLLEPGQQAAVHTPVAIVCGAGFGLLGAALSRIAFRARRLKAVN